ncbi:MAG: anaerobic ribonucleoside-triphosphate reductase, partial [Lachnospiraceae bacterium]|nr:anaerobic ribonucleoside-triphosphate reductase [Lachnospiraceae bacterium]
MKVIKRDGHTVNYDRSKIIIAIQKANAEVEPCEKVTEEKIEEIVQGIEAKNRSRMLVEDIQDIIEQRLMDEKKFVLAKTYIIYRYTRELVRKANTTDDSILSLIQNRNKDVMEENSNKNATVASTQRDLIAGEVSKDLTKRVLLPEKISKAHEEGVLHFHDADYFLQPIFNCCLINIKDMLDNGTVMNGKLIESPKSFQVACTVMTQIISSVASSQYGGQSVDIKHLGKYLRKSYHKYKDKLVAEYGDKIDDEILESMAQERLNDELRSGVQTIQYQINTLMTTNGQSPFVTLFLNLDPNDEYVEENAIIIAEILRQRLEGIKNEKGVYVTPAFPKLIYVLDEHNCLKGGKYDYITRLAVQCSAKRLYPDYISAKKMRENYEGNVFSCMGCRSFLSPWKDENGQSPFVTIFMYIEEGYEYEEEVAMIIEEILKQRLQGIKNEKGVYVTPAFPKLIYVLDENNCLKGGKYDYITKLAVKCSSKRLYPDYISAKKMRENYEGNVFSCMGCRSFLSPWKDE